MGTPAGLVVLGIRADFEARCADYPQLAAAIQGRYLVTSMTERQLQMMITLDEDRWRAAYQREAQRRAGLVSGGVEQAQAVRALAGRRVRVAEADQRLLGVHEAIRVPGVSDEVPPEYVSRDKLKPGRANDIVKPRSRRRARHYPALAGPPIGGRRGAHAGDRHRGDAARRLCGRRCARGPASQHQADSAPHSPTPTSCRSLTQAAWAGRQHPARRLRAKPATVPSGPRPSQRPPGAAPGTMTAARTTRSPRTTAHKGPGGPLYNIEVSNGGLITFPGGVPLKNASGEIIGAIGVSGSTVDNDHAVAVAGASALS